jgi:hypothetical protein
MEDHNLSFLLYLVDPRPVGEVKAAIEHILRCDFRPEAADAPSDELEDSFEAEIFGLYVSLQRGEVWPEGNVYRLGGSTHRRIYSHGGTRLLIDNHVAKALKQGGFGWVMPREEFVATKQQRTVAT